MTPPDIPGQPRLDSDTNGYQMSGRLAITGYGNRIVAKLRLAEF